MRTHGYAYGVPHPFDNNSRGPVTQENKVIHPIFVLLYYILYVFFFFFCWTPCSATSTQNGVKQWHILIFHISHTGPLKNGKVAEGRLYSAVVKTPFRFNSIIGDTYSSIRYTMWRVTIHRVQKININNEQ